MTFRALRSTALIFTVATGFPSGQYRLESRVLEIKLAIEDGADEIDVVINRPAALEQDWKCWLFNMLRGHVIFLPFPA